MKMELVITGWLLVDGEKKEIMHKTSDYLILIHPNRAVNNAE